MLGFIEDPRDVEKYLKTASLGMAVYDPEHNLKRYTDPGKVKWYLSQGVPVVMTKIGNISKMIEDKKCGFVIEYEVKKLTDVITKYFQNQVEMESMMRNSVKLASNYRWEYIFDRVFARMNLK